MASEVGSEFQSIYAKPIPVLHDAVKWQERTESYSGVAGLNLVILDVIYFRNR